MSESELQWSPAQGHGDEVVYAVDGPLGRARLNRPKAINALDRASVDSLLTQLKAWADDPAIEAVFLDGSGERGLCAGGDIRELYTAITGGEPQMAVDYWAAEYELDLLISDYPKPFVAWMDGIVMGGGIGVSAHGSLRLATERTKMAMPETIIGLFPDVGGMWFLSRADGELGTHAALTGVTLNGADTVILGMADAVVSSEGKESILDALRANPALGVDGLPDGVGVEQESSLLAEQTWIDECYVGDDAVTIIERLRGHDAPAAQEAAALLEARSPHSVAVTLEALRRAGSLDVAGVLAQDGVLGKTFASHPDFAEGVRAQVIDKDRQPRWSDASVADVSREQVLAAFGEPG